MSRYDIQYSRDKFPYQKLTAKEKNKTWKESCVNSLIGREKLTFTTSGSRSEKEKIKINYDLYNSKYNIDDLKHITDPFNVDDKFPATPQNFNIVRPKIELLVGEMTKRPKNYKVVKAGDEAISSIEHKAVEMFTTYVLDELSEIAPKEGEEQSPTAEVDRMSLEKINEYLQMDFSDVAEKVAHHTLQYLRKSLNMDNEEIKGWKDGLIAGKEIYYVGIMNGDPVFERVNPLYISYDLDPDLEFIEDGTWAVRRMIMSPESVYDRFYDIMEEKDLNKLLEYTGDRSSMTSRASDVNTDVIRFIESKTWNEDDSEYGRFINVWHTTWKSYKKIGFLTSRDGETEIVDETYKFDEDDKINGYSIEWDWVEETWEGYRIGEDIYVGINPIPYQSISVDNPNNAKLPYTGVIYSDTNSENKSLVDIMKPLQYMYIVIWYRLELALARDKGKVLNMDITQIPKSMGVDVDRWLHYINATGINFINPFDEGWDVVGREGGKPSQFNQISAQDLSMTAAMGDYIALMNKIEEMVGELSGVSKQRQGAISSNELVGNVERAVIQSSHITEPLFWKHNQAIKNATTQLLNAAKVAWADSGKKKLQYVTDDLMRVFLNINDDFLYSDFGVFISDSTKDNRNIEALKSLLQPAMQNGASLLDAAAILTDDNLSSIKRKLAKIEKDRQAKESEIQQQTLQQQAQIHQEEMQMRAEENRIKEEDSIRKADTQIQVALIGAENDAAKINVQADLFKEDLEKQKLEISREKQKADEEVKKRQLDEAIRKNKAAEKQKDAEITLKRKQINKSKISNK